MKRFRGPGRDDWWRPYVAVLLIALAASLAVLLFLLPSLGEISRALRQLGV